MSTWTETVTYIKSQLRPGVLGNTNVQKILNAVLAVIQQINAGDYTATPDALWKPDVSYAIDTQPVLWQDQWLVSNVADNLGNVPISTAGIVHPSWRVIGSSAGSGIRAWQAIVYPNSLELIFQEGKLYYLNREIVGVDPFVSVDFAIELVEEKWKLIGGESLDENILQALLSASSPSASNPFATIDDIPEPSTTIDSAIVQGLEASLPDSPSTSNKFVTVSLLNSYTYVQEAPINGSHYARKDGAWVAFNPFTVAGTPTNGHVITSVGGVPTWQAPSGGSGLQQGLNTLTERLRFRGGAWPQNGSYDIGASFLTIENELGNTIFDLNPRNGNSYAAQGRLWLRNTHLFVETDSNHWGVPVFTLRSGAVNRFVMMGDGSITLASLAVAGFTTSSFARMTVTFQSWGSREFGVLYNNTNGYNYGGRWMMESINGTLVIRAVNLRAINDTTAHSVRVANDSNVETLRILGNHSIILSQYPTTNPLTAGRLWVDPSDGFTIKVSQG